MSLESLLTSGIPLNRKERFYTATVLPLIVCAEEFTRFQLFLDLAQIQPLDIIPAPRASNIQFTTEYSLKDAAGQQHHLNKGFAPDLLIHIVGEKTVLLSVEGKMFDYPSQSAFERQLRNQWDHVIVPLQKKLQADLVRQVALLPRALAKKYSLPSAIAVVTWEDVVDAYSEVAPDSHFVGVLRLALAGDYASPPSTWRQFSDARISGWKIYRCHSEPDFHYKSVGCQGGEYGKKFIGDIQHHSWLAKKYEVSLSDMSDRPNWFSIHRFVAAVRDYAELTKIELGAIQVIQGK